jgi:hypothetical protein
MQGFEGYVESNLPAVFEEVGQGLGDAVHSQRTTLDLVFLDPFAERVAAEADEPHRREVERRLARAAFRGDPDLGRKLCPDFVELQGREEAEDAFGHGARDDEEAMVLRHLVIHGHVLSRRDALEETVSHEPRQRLRV